MQKMGTSVASVAQKTPEERVETLGTGVPLWTQWKAHAVVFIVEQEYCNRCTNSTKRLSRIAIELRAAPDQTETPHIMRKMISLEAFRERYKGLETALGNSAEDFKYPVLPTKELLVPNYTDHCYHCRMTLIDQMPWREYTDKELHLPRDKESLDRLLAPKIAPEKANAEGYCYESPDASMLGGGNLRPTLEEYEKERQRRKQGGKKLKPKAKKAKAFNLAKFL